MFKKDNIKTNLLLCFIKGLKVFVTVSVTTVSNFDYTNWILYVDFNMLKCIATEGIHI